MLVNIAIASLMMLVTTVVHVVGISLLLIRFKATVEPRRLRHQLARARKIGGITLLMFFLSMAEMWAWAWLYLRLGVFEKMETAMYFSAVTFTTLGYGDIVLDDRWRLTAALEAANGIIIFGLSTAAVVAAVQMVYHSDLSASHATM